MEIILKEVTVGDVVKNYTRNLAGVVEQNGHLNIAQLNFVDFKYSDNLRNNVVSSVRSGYPIGTMTWRKNPDNTYVILDGAQRILSICNYVTGNFSVGFKFFHNLNEAGQAQILNFPLMVHVCNGTDREIFDWLSRSQGLPRTTKEKKRALKVLASA